MPLIFNLLKRLRKLALKVKLKEFGGEIDVETEGDLSIKDSQV